MMPMLRKPAVLYSLLALILIGAAGGGAYLYLKQAFPEVRCEAAKHLETPADYVVTGDLGDCYECHAKVTPKVAQEWLESKHGVMLIRCPICHGQPDGKGSLPFTRSPSVTICAQCHAPSMDTMTAKFGKRDDCATCHFSHQSPMHGKAFENRSAASKTSIN